MEKKIKYDFTANAVEQQPMAIMPAELAKELLMEMAQRLCTVRAEVIMHELINKLSHAEQTDPTNLEYFNGIVLSYINKRSLIDNIVMERWDVYEVK